jgi:O-antigen ligase
MLIPHRRTLIFLLLTLTFAASVLYDSLWAQYHERLQLVLGAAIGAALAAVLLLQQYPAAAVQPALLATWPLHLFTLAFFWVCLMFHGGHALGQVVIYTVFGYATYLLLPAIFLIDRSLFQSFVKLVAVGSALLAIPSLAGAAGMESLAGFPLRNKPYYAEFSGVTASGGIFEHVEGHAFQMGIGLLCSLYVLRELGGHVYLGCFALSALGLVISQGRAALFGIAVALMYCVLPELFRRSRPMFLGTLALTLAFPFLIWPQLAKVPGVSAYLRIERGLSGRDEAWQYAWWVIQQKPWTGHGFLASSELTEAEQKTLRRSGFSGGGTTFHNTFITKAVDLGLIVTAIYALLYLVPLIRGCTPSAHPRDDTLIRSMVLLTITTALYRDYNIGGVRSTAMAGAMFLGLANLRHVDLLYRPQVILSPSFIASRLPWVKPTRT